MKNLFKTLLVNLLCISTAYSAPVDIAPFKTTSAQINQITNKAGTGPVEFPAGITGGASEINLVKNSNNATNWTASGAGITVATTTTASDLPLNATTAIKITPVSGTDYAKYCVSLPTALKNKKLKFEWWQHYLSGYTSGDLKLEIYKNSSTNCGGSNTKIALSTDDTSAITSIPALDGKFSSYFDTETNDSYEIRFVRVSGTTALVISNVVFGPGIQPQGAVAEEWKTFTPTGSWTTNTSYTGRYRRVGDSMRVTVTVSTSGAPTATSLLVNIPSGFNIDTTKLASTTGGQQNLGGGVANDAGTRSYPLTVYYNSATSVGITSAETTGEASSAVTEDSPFTFGSGDAVSINFIVPIAEWSGSGTLNVAQNDVEYGFNTDTSTSDNLVAFGYGPEGVSIGSFTSNTTGDTTKRVRFPTPIQTGDIIEIEVLSTSLSNSAWTSSEEQVPYSFLNTSRYGIHWAPVSGSSTDIDVLFGKAGATPANVATYGGNNGDPWSGFSAFKWRAKKSKGGQAVGFGKATPQSAGIVTSYSPTVRSRYLAVSSTNYTILDSDGYDTILVTTGASTRTITLPAVANNAGRILTIKKEDSGAGTVLIDTPGSEGIDSAAQNELFEQFAFITIISNGTNWRILGAYDLIRGSSINQNITNVEDTSIVADVGEQVTGSNKSLIGIWVVDAMAVYNGGQGNNCNVFKAGIVNTSTSETLSDSTPTGYIAFMDIPALTDYGDRVSINAHRVFDLSSGPGNIEVRVKTATPGAPAADPNDDANVSIFWTYKRIR